MAKKFKKYNKKFEFSYSFGTFSTLELLKKRPDSIIQIVTDGKENMNIGINQIIEIASTSKIQILKDESFLRRIAGQDNHACMGIFYKYEDKLSSTESHVVLVTPSFPGNVGTIIRTALGFGIKNIAIIKPGVDHFDPKVIRASMGSIFSVRIQQFDSIESYVSQFKSHKKYALMVGAANELRTTQFDKPTSLILGNEGEGLPDSYKQFCTPISISHSDEIDSLNVSTAAAISMYELYNQK